MIKIRNIVLSLCFLYTSEIIAINSKGSGMYNCTMSTTSMAFGNFIAVNNTASTTTATITVTCTATTASTVQYTVTASAGNSGNQNARYMSDSSSDSLSYNAYTSTSYAQVFGTTYIIQINYSLAANASQTDNHIIYGKIPAAPSAVINNYTDTLVLTLSY